MSEKPTLIAYATRGGTTEEYAKAISSVLTDEFNVQADLVNLRKAPSFSRRRILERNTWEYSFHLWNLARR
jgi:flavodoxin